MSFVEKYPKDKEKVFQILESCVTQAQLKSAENCFNTLKQKWAKVTENNQTAKAMLDVDEKEYKMLLSHKKFVLSF